MGGGEFIGYKILPFSEDSKYWIPDRVGNDKCLIFSELECSLKN